MNRGVKFISQRNGHMMSIVQNVPLGIISPVLTCTTSWCFSLVALILMLKYSTVTVTVNRHRAAKHHGNRPTSVQHYTIEKGGLRKNCKKKKEQSWMKVFFLFMGKIAILLTCTVKASFAKKRCSSLFLRNKRLGVCVLEWNCASRGWVWLYGVPQQGPLLSQPQTVWHWKVLKLNQVILHGS